MADEECSPVYHVTSYDSNRSYLVQAPASDIDTYIRFSRVRCLLSVFSLLLVCSDVPRSGLGLKDLTSIMVPITPDSGAFFGPYAYPVVRITKMPSNSKNLYQYEGSCDGEEITSAEVWSYKFDSVSIAQRALLQELQATTAWPQCILYQEDCADTRVSLETTFAMIDALVSAVHVKLFPNQETGATSQPFGFIASSNWIDRIHHYLLALLRVWRQEIRIASVHYYQVKKHSNASLDICDRSTPYVNRPFECDMGIGWLNTLNDSTTAPLLPFGKHLWLRVQSLQQLYPHLNLDVTMISSIVVSSNVHDAYPARWAFFRIDIGEVTTLIRGRSCFTDMTASLTKDSDCETVFVDDYRYERSTILTDVNQWYYVASILRGFSQCYIWLRLVLLWFGCYKARSSEPKFLRASRWEVLRCTWATFFRIPGNVIVYTSWMSLLGYAAAHLLDSTLVHTHADVLGASLNGVNSYGFVTFAQAASVQMRNIWSLAALSKVLILIQVHCLPARWQQKHGLQSVRGGWIGFISALTLLGPRRVIAARNSNVTSVRSIPSESILSRAHLAFQGEVTPEFGPRLDIKTIFEACFWSLSAILSLKCCIALARYRWRNPDRPSLSRMRSSLATSVFFCRNNYLPYSVGTLFDASALSIFWRITLVRSKRIQIRPQSSSIIRFIASSTAQSMKKLSIGFLNSTARAAQRAPSAQTLTCRSCIMSNTQWGWPSEQGCADHDNFYRIDHRSHAIWSMVRLINLAMLTDPIVWLSLYLFSRPLFLYRIPYDRYSKKSKLVLLPCSPQLIEESEDHCNYDLVDIIDSSSVPWTLLLECG